MTAAVRRPGHGKSKAALLDAAVEVIRAQGLHATTVDDLCTTAGVTKGAFFHHFASKEALAIAAADHWSDTTASLFAAARYHELDDPTDRVFGYLDFRTSLIAGSPADYSCLVGTMAQEAFATNPAIRDACAASIFGHAETLEADLAAALDDSNVADAVASPASLARHIQAVLQGAFVLSKAADEPRVVLEHIDHLRRYLECVLGRTSSEVEQ